MRIEVSLKGLTLAERQAKGCSKVLVVRESGQAIRSSYKSWAATVGINYPLQWLVRFDHVRLLEHVQPPRDWDDIDQTLGAMAEEVRELSLPYSRIILLGTQVGAAFGLEEMFSWRGRYIMVLSPGRRGNLREIRKEKESWASILSLTDR